MPHRDKEGVRFKSGKSLASNRFTNVNFLPRIGGHNRLRACTFTPIEQKKTYTFSPEK
jgi:hypothetical protein